MALEIEGTIVQLLPLQTGESARGPWKKQDYILETEGQYPKKVCFNVWGDKIDTFGISQGDKVKVSIEIESREYNSRWYTDIRAWRVEKAAAQPASNPPDFGGMDAGMPPPPEEDEDGDGLPF